MARQFYANSGQVCVAGSRIIVERSIKDRVIEGLTEQLRMVNVGDPFAQDTDIGALISKRQLDRVLDYVAEGVDQGAELHLGGHRIGDRGFFVEPTLFSGPNTLTIAQEEIFGPVGLVTTFDTYEQSIELANDTRYGLAATVYTRDLSTAHRVAARLHTGMVRVNGSAGIPSPSTPFGGRKESGLGRELSFSGIEACTVQKTVSIEL
jgi:betaine-aldehyde dehydrogenase